MINLLSSNFHKDNICTKYTKVTKCNINNIKLYNDFFEFIIIITGRDSYGNKR